MAADRLFVGTTADVLDWVSTNAEEVPGCVERWYILLRIKDRATDNVCEVAHAQQTRRISNPERRQAEPQRERRTATTIVVTRDS